MAGDANKSRVVVGSLVGLHGLKGDLKLHSYTAPRENIFGYSPWLVGKDASWTVWEHQSGRRQGKGLVVRLAGIEDRTDAEPLVGQEIAVLREQLPELANDEYYWSELVGLKVINQDGADFGVVDHLLETGANDVLVVRGDRQRLIPYTPGHAVVAVDLDAQLIRVDWHPDD